MSTLQKIPSNKAKVYQKRAVSTYKNEISVNVIDDISDLDLLALQPNQSVSTFNGFFEEKPKQTSLTYELCNEYAELFIATSQYLWGPRSTASILQAIKELMSLREFEEIESNENNADSISKLNFDNKKDDDKEQNKEDDDDKTKKTIKKNRKMKKTPWTLSLQKAGEALCKELENREIINNNMLIGNLSNMS